MYRYTTHPATRTSLTPLQNIKDKLKAHMSEHHRLEDANTDAGYYNFWMRLQLTNNYQSCYKEGMP